jgi:hypothetical protein
MDDYEERRILSMWKTKRAAMTLALGILLVLFSTAFAAASPQTSMSRTASSPPTTQQVQFGWSGWSQVPGNGFTLSGPATTFNSSGNDYVFVRGTNNRIYANTLSGTTWSGWSEVPGHGLTPSGPAVSTNGSGTLNLFVRGTDNKIYTNTFNGASWSGWSQVPGHGFTIDTPAALGGSLFVRGTNDRIYANTFNGTTWSGWSEVPGHGLTLSGPAALSGSLYVRGTNDHLYANTLSGTTWSGWSEVPGHGLTLSGPAATILDVLTLKGIVELFVRGTDNKIYVNAFDNGTWSGWGQVPGNGFTPDAPGATAFLISDLGPSQLNLFVRGTNNRIYVNILRVTS